MCIEETNTMEIRVLGFKSRIKSTIKKKVEIGPRKLVKLSEIKPK